MKITRNNFNCTGIKPAIPTWLTVRGNEGIAEVDLQGMERTNVGRKLWERAI